MADQIRVVTYKSTFLVWCQTQWDGTDERQWIPIKSSHPRTVVRQKQNNTSK